MSSNSRPIIILSDVDIEDAMSSTIPMVTPVQPAPLSPPLAQDTEAFYEDEVAPTPQISPIAPPLVTRPLTDSSSHTSSVPAEPVLMFPRRKTVIGARKSVRRVTTTFRTPAIPTLPPSSDLPTTTPATTPSPALSLPPKKRARCTTPALPTTQISDLPPPAHYHIGESSRAAAARVPTALTLDAQLTDQQGQLARLSYRVDEILAPRLDVVEEDVEDLVQGRVSIDVSYHGLETRQLAHQELIDQLRDELPEIRDRAEQTQEELRRQAIELASVRAALTASQSRETDLQLRVEQLEKVAISMAKVVKTWRRGPDGPGGPSGAPGSA